MRRSLRIASVALALPFLAGMAPYHVLDDLLEGMAGPCPSNPAWRTLVGSLVDGNLNLTGRVDVPEGLAQAFGTPRIVGDDPEAGEVAVEVPVIGGALRGMPVTALAFGFARDYPLIDYGVRFDAAISAEDVRAAFADDIARFEADNPESIVEHSIEDGTAVVLRCFAVN